MSKTLGQLYHDAQWPQYDYDKADKWRNEREAAGIAAVARHVVAELLAAHVAEFHAPQPGPNAWASRPWEMSEKPVESADVTKWKTTDGGKLVPDPPKPEAGDWAMKAYVEAEEKYNAISAMNGADYAAAADAIREAAERHYSRLGSVEHAKRLADRLDVAEKERDAARAEHERLRKESEDQPRYYIDQKGKLWYGGRSVRSDNYHYREFFGWTDPRETILREIWIWARSDADKNWRVVSEEEAREHIAGHLPKWPRIDTTPPAATGEDELRDAVRDGLAASSWKTDLTTGTQDIDAVMVCIRPLFDALRRERDEAKRQLAEAMEPDDIDDDLKMVEDLLAQAFVGKATTIIGKAHLERWQKNLSQAKQRAESAEAALEEMRAAVDWSWSSLHKQHFIEKTHAAILAAYRATKAATGAAEEAVKS